MLQEPAPGGPPESSGRPSPSQRFLGPLPTGSSWEGHSPILQPGDPLSLPQERDPAEVAAGSTKSGARLPWTALPRVTWGLVWVSGEGQAAPGPPPTWNTIPAAQRPLVSQESPSPRQNQQAPSPRPATHHTCSHPTSHLPGRQHRWVASGAVWWQGPQWVSLCSPWVPAGPPTAQQGQAGWCGCRRPRAWGQPSPSSLARPPLWAPAGSEGWEHWATGVRAPGPAQAGTRAQPGLPATRLSPPWRRKPWAAAMLLGQEDR